MLPSNQTTLLRPNKKVVASGDAAQTTAFLARTSGLSGTETTAYKALINGLVTDSTFSLLDGLWILATKDRTTACLNLLSTSYTLIEHVTFSAETFTPDVGYTGDGFAFYMDTQIVPGSGGALLSQNSASMGVYVLNNRTVADGSTNIGCQDSNYCYMKCLGAGSKIEYNPNDDYFNGPSAATAQGFTAFTRTNSSTAVVYRNNSTALDTDTRSSVGVPTASPTIFAISGAQQSSDQMSAAFVGGAITGAQFLAISNRVNAYMTALGINVY